MRILIVVIAILVLNGCESGSEAYNEFTSTYGTDSRYFCDEETSFLMYEFINKLDKVKHTSIVTDDTGYPVECNLEQGVEI